MSTRLKFTLTYIGGIITGVLLFFVLCYVLSSKSEGETSYDIVMFDKPQSKIETNEFQIIQVLTDGSALAAALDINYVGTIVLFLPNKDAAYYDNQKILVHKGKCIRQIGIYKYKTMQDMVKTVPVVDFYDNN
jgi:hypothetical protein